MESIEWQRIADLYPEFGQRLPIFMTEPRLENEGHCGVSGD
jgi:hypothetical protein